MESLADKHPLTVVAIGAHPDPFDMPYQAGATLAKYAKRGHQVVMVSASFEDDWADEVRAIAGTLGCTQEWLDFEEGAIFDDPSHVQRIMELLTSAPGRSRDHPPADRLPPRSSGAVPCRARRVPARPGRGARIRRPAAQDRRPLLFGDHQRHELARPRLRRRQRGDYFEKRRNTPARQRRLVAQLEAMGHRVTLAPAA